MDARIRFESKDESNARREREFLALTPAERLGWFLRSFNGRTHTSKDDDKPENFIIRKRDDADLRAGNLRLARPKDLLDVQEVKRRKG